LGLKRLAIGKKKRKKREEKEKKRRLAIEGKL
jgi:hypothetical protein